MKIDDMLCEMLDTVNDTEAEMLDKTLAELKNKKLQRRTEKLTLKVQKKLAMDKIYAQAHREGTLKFRYPGKRRIVLLMVVFIMALGVAVSAKENDWDIQMAEMLGLSGVMEEMEGGYIPLTVSQLRHHRRLVTRIPNGCSWIQMFCGRLGQMVIIYLKRLMNIIWTKRECK